jgi:hypothetical protein
MRRAVFVFAFGGILVVTDAFGLSHGVANPGTWKLHSEPTLLVLFGAALMLTGKLTKSLGGIGGHAKLHDRSDTAAQAWPPHPDSRRSTAEPGRSQTRELGMSTYALPFPTPSGRMKDHCR